MLVYAKCMNAIIIFNTVIAKGSIQLLVSGGPYFFKPALFGPTGVQIFFKGSIYFSFRGSICFERFVPGVHIYLDTPPWKESLLHSLPRSVVKSAVTEGKTSLHARRH